MTSTTLDERSGDAVTNPDSVAPTAVRPRRVTAGRVLRSEWTKFRTVRSTGWTLLAAAILTIALGAIISAVQANQYASMTAMERAFFDPVQVSLAGINFAELAIGVLGILVICGEYSTGMIRASLTAVPKRLPVLAAKAAVTAAATLVVMTIASFAAFFAGQALLDHHGLGTTLSAPGALQSVAGAALVLTVLAVIGVATGTVLRNTAGAITTFVGVFFVLPRVVNLLPVSWSTAITPYLPSGAANALVGAGLGSGDTLRPWTGFGLLCGYAVALVVLAAWKLRRRDA